MKTKLVHKPRLRAAWCAFASAVLMLAGSQTAPAFTSGDATTSYNAWWGAFTPQPFGSQYNQFWAGAEMVETVEDYGNVADINAACSRFIATNGSDWSYLSSNDDIMWAVIAFTRAYTATGNTAYRTYAKNGFDLVYGRGWDTVAGGMWWNTTKDYKPSCISFPTAIAAKLLSVALGDSSYATKSQNIYNWGKANLWNSSTGQVSDGLHPPSSVDWTSYSYNQGSFIGAAYYNGDTSAVTLAGNYAKNTWGVTLPVYATAGADASGFNGIFLRWLGKSGYDPVWRQAIANNAWSKRNSSNLVNNQWDRVTPNTAQNGWDCGNMVTALITVAPDVASLATQPSYYMLVNKATGKCVDLIGGNMANGAVTNQWTYDYNGPNQRWAFLPTEAGNHFKIVSWVSSKCICPDLDSTADGAQMHAWDYTGNNPAQQWDLVDAGNGWFKIRNVNSGKVLDLDAGNTADNAKIQQWTDLNGVNQLWRLQPWGDYYIQASTGKYICIQGASSANGSPIIQYTGEANPWFKWRFENVGDGIYKVSSLNALGRTISIVNGSTAPAANGHLWDYGGGGDQKMLLKPLTNGKVKLYFTHTGMSWDIPGGNAADNTPLQQYPDNGNVWQQFLLQRVP